MQNEIRLDARCLSREQAQDYLAQRLTLPGCYGWDLDALHKCLTEVVGMTLVIEHIEQAPPFFETLQQAIQDAAVENSCLQVRWYAGAAPRFPADAPEWDAKL